MRGAIDSKSRTCIADQQLHFLARFSRIIVKEGNRELVDFVIETPESYNRKLLHLSPNGVGSIAVSADVLRLLDGCYCCSLSLICFRFRGI